MANVIVGIHGLSNKPDETTLADWWERSIREGLQKNLGIANADFQFKMVYWASLVYSRPQHTDPDFIHDTLYNSQPYQEAPDGALKEHHDNWVDGARGRIGKYLGPSSDWAMKAIGKGRLVNSLLRAKIQDLAFYYDSSKELRSRDGVLGVARAVLKDDLATALLNANGDNMMLIAHSMGSIIGYDVLRDLGRRDGLDFSLQDFVTIGSPLGVGLVKNNVKRERASYRGGLRTPTVVTGGWVNFADRLDPVAFDAHLRDDYGPNGSGVRVRDDLIHNDYSIAGHRNPHKSYGYLRTPEISRHIQEFLGTNTGNG